MTESNAKRVGGLLLAAGGSRRLGSPKQLLEFEGKTLLRRAAEALVECGCIPVVVVLGAEIEGSKAEMKELNVTTVVNDNWESGMSSSIRIGLANLLSLEPEIDALMITLCDQPFVTAAKIRLFINEFDRNKVAIIAAKYKDVLGVPALFSRELFNAVLNLQGDKGARDLIRQTETAIAIELPEASFDIDTWEDLESLVAPT